jgi:hypothetical protein
MIGVQSTYVICSSMCCDSRNTVWMVLPGLCQYCHVLAGRPKVMVVFVICRANATTMKPPAWRPPSVGSGGVVIILLLIAVSN